MHKLPYIISAACAALLSVTAASALADVTLVSPKSGETVRQLKPLQAKFVQESLAEREKYFDGAKNSAALRKQGNGPQPIVLKWQGGEGPWQVVVRRLPDGKVFCSQSVKGEELSISGLEIARDWEWAVKGAAGEAKGTFKTKDLAPRVIAEMPNCRDIGGRIGLGGKRIRQGLVYRSAGLNYNAPIEYYTNADEVVALDKKGKLKKMGHVGRKLHRLLKQGGKIDLKKDRLVKRECYAPGKKRFTEQQRLDILARYGIKSDIDLRRPSECYGMTGSPLGDTVKWFNYSYSAYGGLYSPNGTNSTRNVFRVFLNPQNYPIDFHCIGGADRTGTVAFLLEALLGVDENNLYMDYLFTGFSGVVSDKSHRGKIEEVAKFLRKHPGETLAQKAEAYFKNLGFTQRDIDSLRDFLLE